MTREDRLLLTELARLNTAITPLAMHIMEDSATAEECYTFVKRFAVMALLLEQRATHAGPFVDGTAAITANGNSKEDKSTAHEPDR